MSRWHNPRTLPKGETLEQELEYLFMWIEADTGFSSRLKDSLEHPAYKTLIEYREKAVPFILSLFASTCPWWVFSALRDLTGIKPVVPKEVRGMHEEIRKVYAKELLDKGIINPIQLLEWEENWRKQ